MKTLLVILLFITASASAQTTYILVRHAEKESAGNDPELSSQGQERAKRLVSILEAQKVDAIYSTNFNRTKNTVKPLADSKGLQLSIYEKQPDVAAMKGTVVICGHSNTIPALANQLLGKEQFTNFPDSDYGNLLIIKDGTVTHLRY